MYVEPFVRDGYALGFGVHLRVVRGDGASAYCYVLEDVADGVVDGAFDPVDTGAGGVEDLVPFDLGERVARAVVFAIYSSSCGGGGGCIRV